MKDAHETHLYIPKSLHRKLKAKADANRRTFNAETLIAIEKYVEPDVKGKPNVNKQR